MSDAPYRLVYLPAPGSVAAATIDRGSGIVGRPDPRHEDRLVIDFEGGRYASNIVTFADRVHHAAGRQLSDYPTTARLFVPLADVRQIGVFDDLTGDVLLTESGAAEALAAWLDVREVAPAELQTTGARHEQRRTLAAELASGDPARIATAKLWATRLDLRA